jgi:hypothetical protein
MPSIAVLIPSYRGMRSETRGAIGRMVAASTPIADVSIRPVLGNACVHWTRNTLLAALYRDNATFTHVLFCDDDMVPSPDALAVLLSRNVDVIGAVCTTRKFPPTLNITAYDSQSGAALEVNIDKRGIHRVEGVGAGFMLISRTALEAVAEYTLRQTYNRDFLGMNAVVAAQLEERSRHCFSQCSDARWFEFLRNPKTGGEFSEDVSFCIKAKECGFPVYADSTLNVGHVGDSYTFSLEDYFRAKHPENKSTKGKIF